MTGFNGCSAADLLQRVMSNDLHVVPENDLREHTTKRDCWCGPTQDPEEPLLWVHHSMDGREAFETGERLPS